MKNKSPIPGITTVFALSLVAALAQSTWNGGTSTDWATAGNWSAGVPAAGTNVTIADTTTNNLTLDTSRTIGQLVYGASGTRISAFTLQTNAANNLTLNGGVEAAGAWTASGTALALRGHYTVAADQVWTVGGAGGKGSANNNTDQGVQVREVAAGTRGSLTLNGNLTKEGTGQLMLTAVDVLGAGNLIISNGGVKLNAGSSALLNLGGTGNITVNNAANLSVYRNSGTMTISRDLIMNGTASLDTSNGAAVDIASKTTWNGTHAVDIRTTTNLTGAWLGGGTINRTGTAALNVSGDLTGFTGTFNNTTAGTTTFSGNLGGNLGMTAGTLAGEVAVAGNISLGGGTVNVNPATPGSLSAGGNLTLTGTTTVSLVSAPAASGVPFTVLTYGGTLTGGAANLAMAPGYRSPVFDTATAGQVKLTVGSENRTWAGPGNWDVNTSTNWTGGDGKFFQLDNVTFGDAGAGTVAITGVLTPGSVTIGSSANYTFTAAAGNYLAGSGGLTKNGSGTATLGGINTFTGPVVVNAGTLKAGSSQAFGANGNTISVAAGATLDFGGVSNANRDYHATISGTGVGGAGALVNTGAGANNGLGKLTLAADASMGGTGRFDVRPVTAGQGLLDLGGFTLTKTGANNIAIVDAQATAAGSIDIQQGTLSITRTNISGTGTVTVRSGAFLMLENYTAGAFTKALSLDGGTVQSQGAAFTMGSEVGLTAGNGTFAPSGVALTLSGNVTGPGGLTKTGTGTLILGGAGNTYSGATTVSAGTLLVNGLLTSPSVSLAAGTTLGGSAGTLTGTVTTQAGSAVIAPGTSPGTLTVGSLDVTLGSRFIFELGTTQDLLNVTGTLTAGVQVLAFDFLDAGGLTGGVPYTLINYGSATGLEAADLSAAVLPAGFSLDTAYGTGGWNIGSSSLTVQFVPEPSSFALGALGLLALGRRRRSLSVGGADCLK